jgi:hypothetical protein
MIVSKKHNFVFIKTRKTAGSTLEKLYRPLLGDEDYCSGSSRDENPAKNMPEGTNGHVGWEHIKNQYCNDKWWEEAYKFTIERNPWDKVVSSYYWHQKIKPQEYAGMDFEKYVLTCQLLPMDYHHYANRGTLMVNNVYKYEEIDKMYAELNDKFGFNITTIEVFGTRMKGDIRKERDYKKLHTPRTIEFVERFFKPTIDLLGYTYE